MVKVDETYTDGYGRTEKQIYEELLKGCKIPKDFDTFVEDKDGNDLFLEFHFWDDDANDLLANIGLGQDFDSSAYPKDQLKRIFRYYHDGQKKMVDGKKVDNDPLPDYRVGDDSYEKEMFKFGYALGKGGDLGIYFRLLPIFQFRRGYWVGKMERSIELNDIEILRELSNEIKLYDAKQANDEMGFIVNNIFKEEPKQTKNATTVVPKP